MASQLGLPEGEKREPGEILSCDMCFDGRYYAVSGFITGAIGAKFPGMNHLVEGVVDTTVSAGERLMNKSILMNVNIYGKIMFPQRDRLIVYKVNY